MTGLCCAVFGQVIIGNREWMRNNGVAVPDVVDQQMSQQENLGHTAVLVAINGGLTLLTVPTLVVG